MRDAGLRRRAGERLQWGGKERWKETLKGYCGEIEREGGLFLILGRGEVAWKEFTSAERYKR